MTANTTQYYGKAGAQHDKAVADDLKASHSLIYKIWPYIHVVFIGGALSAAAAIVLSTPKMEYDANGTRIIHLEDYKHAHARLPACTYMSIQSNYIVYENGKPMKCPTPQ